MDPGEYETNTLLIDNVASVAFKIYEPVVSNSSTYTFSASDVEHTLRKQGNLVYADPLRRVIWCFSLTANDGSPLGRPGEPVLGANLDVCGYRLGLVEEGGLEPLSLLKNRILTPNSLSTPSSSSPSGPALDPAMRGAQTPGGIMNPASFPVEGDAKASFGSSVDSKGYGSIPAKDIHEYFIAAVLASLSHRFCTRTGAVPLDSRSFVLPSPGAYPGTLLPVNSPMVASLRVHLTTTGCLLIGMSLSFARGLQVNSEGLSHSLPQNGATVFAAPFGVFGTCQALDGDQTSIDGSAIESPNTTQITRFRPDMDGRSGQWRSTCYKLLEMRGISTAILNRSPWLSIRFLRRKPNEAKSDGKRTPLVNPQTHILWPAALCFRKHTRDHVVLNRTVDPGGTSLRDGFDPLDHAKSWYMSNGEREELIERRRKEREAAAPKDDGELDLQLLQQDNPPSPVVMRRTSNAGAGASASTGVSAMYPTPPDAVQNPAGVMFSIDGTASSPGNQVPSAVLVDPDTTMTAPEEGLVDAFGDDWDNNEAKGDQSIVQNEDFELNNDVFVDDDITDADFNFFDQQPGSTDVSMPDLPDVSPGQPNPESSDPSTLPEPPKPPEPAAPAEPAEPAEPSESSEPAEPPEPLAPPEPPASAPLEIIDPQTPPMFAKPALKDARSTLGDNPQRNNANANANANAAPSNGIKRQPSPFDPAAVYKRLKASAGGGLRNNSSISKSLARRGSVFHKLDFDSSLNIVNKKYEQSGRFNFNWVNEETTPRTSGSPPTTDYLRRHGKSRRMLKDLPSNLGVQIAKITGAAEGHSVEIDPVKDGDSASDADAASLVSDPDDPSDLSDDASSPTKLNAMRRRLGGDNEMVATSIRDFEMTNEPYVGVDLSKLLITTPSELPVARYFADAEPIPQRLSYEDDDYMMIAQILTEQAVSGRLKIMKQESTAPDLDFSCPQRDMVLGIRNSLRTLQAVLPPCLQSASVCQFRQLLEVQDVPLLATPSRLQPRPAGGPEQRPSLVQVPPPHLELNRHESTLSVLPSAATFWESLGLGPLQGPKDVQAICVFPNLSGMADNAGIFMDRPCAVYGSLRLGNFERMQNGLVPFEVDKTNNSPIASQGSRSGPPLIEDMAKLAVTIFNSTAVSKNFVIYFVYTPDNPKTIVESCAAFQRLFEIYKRVLAERKKQPQNELVLQLVSLDDIATSTSIVILSPHDYSRICLETYDRCTLFEGNMPAPAIVLEQPMIRGIDFHLRNPPSAHILHENSCMHVAYAQSVDERWITAAWSDNRGSNQLTVSYCLGRKGKPLSRSFAEIAREIWTTTYDMTSIWRVHWRVIITKIGTMNQQEVNDWTTLAQAETKFSATLILLTVDTDPSLQLIPPMPSIPTTVYSAFYSTPVSTPQSSMVSPEQFGNPPTPSQIPTTPGAENNTPDADSDTILVDITDTTWAGIASHRLNTSLSLGDPSPALVSGYLVRRGGARPEDPPAVMEVNVMFAEGNPRMHEILLREMLTYLRGLATIARLRSVTNQQGDVRPWHVAAAEKGVETLYKLM